MNTQQTRMYNDVSFLTSIRPYRNFKNLESLEKVVNYMQTEFQKYGYQPLKQNWSVNGNEYTNLIASYNEHKTKRLIIGAHYDVCGNQDGADDNASAIAGLLETARLIAEKAPDLDYRIDLVAYCLEEPPFFGTENMGSYIHAKSLFDNNEDIIGMICYEMIGYFSDEPNSQKYPSPTLAKLYPSIANFIVVVGIKEYRAFNDRVYRYMKKNGGIDVQIINFPSDNDLAGLSDQRNYWKFGYNALMINDTSFIRNPNYHKKSDTIDTLDFSKMSTVINCCYNAIVNF